MLTMGRFWEKQKTGEIILQQRRAPGENKLLAGMADAHTNTSVEANKI